MHFICHTTFHCARVTPSLQHSYFGSSLLALCNHPHMVTTWASSFPKPICCKHPPKCVPPSICGDCFLQMCEAFNAVWARSLPAACTAMLSMTVRRTRRCAFACLDRHDTQTTRHMTKPQRLLCSTFGIRAGANRPPLLCHVTYDVCCVTARSTHHIWLCVWSCAASPKPQNGAKQTDEPLVTPCLPNFKSHTYSP